MVITKMVWNCEDSTVKPGPFRHRVVKRVPWLILIAFIIAVLPEFTLAHPPATMDPDYNLETQTLSIAISHPVSDPDSHYVSKIAITKNGVPLLTEEYSSQPSPSSFTYTYSVAAGEGDVLDVTAYCNLYGSMQKQITISTPSPALTPTSAPVHSPTPTTETPGFELVVALIGIGVGLYHIKR